MVWTIDTLAAGRLDLELVARVRDPLPAGAGSVANSATISHLRAPRPRAEVPIDERTDTNLLDAAPDLRVTKDDGRARVEGDDAVTYVVSVANVGNQDATGVVVIDTLPPGVTFVACTGGCVAGAAPVMHLAHRRPWAPASGSTWS